MVIKKRYTVKKAQEIASAAGYELVHMEGWGSRFYTICLNGEAKVQGQKLSSLMQWVSDNPLSAEVVEETTTEETKGLSILPLVDTEKAIASQVIKTVFGAVREASQVLGLRVYDSTVEIVTVDSLWTLGRDYFKQLVIQFKQQFQVAQPSDCQEGVAASYVMALETSLEKSEAQSIQQQRFSQIALAAPYGLEIDSVKPDYYRAWAGVSLLGTIRYTSKGLLPYPSGSSRLRHSTPNAA